MKSPGLDGRGYDPSDLCIFVWSAVAHTLFIPPRSPLGPLKYPLPPSRIIIPATPRVPSVTTVFPPPTGSESIVLPERPSVPVSSLPLAP